MKYEVAQLGPMLVAGIEIRTTNENWQSAKDIGAHWGEFYREQIKSKIPNKQADDVLGLYCEYEKDHTKPYTFVTGCAVKMAQELPPGLVLKKIPAAKYAVFNIKGKFPDALMDVWQWIWQDQLRRTYTGDFELYPEGWDPEGNPEMQLYVAIS